jgi:hypothetical protein
VKAEGAMTGEAFEYAIKKDVRNNPIVREIDRERHREMWRSAGVGLFLVVVLVFFVWQQTNLYRQDNLVHDTQADLAEQQKVNEQLRVKIATMRTATVIEPKARRLEMVEPGPDDSTVIQRVITSQPPANSVLARR